MSIHWFSLCRALKSMERTLFQSWAQDVDSWEELLASEIVLTFYWCSWIYFCCDMLAYFKCAIAKNRIALWGEVTFSVKRSYFMMFKNVSNMCFILYSILWKWQDVCRSDRKAQRGRLFALSCIWGGRAVGVRGSQMKQIKGEPWPPGETLAGHRDEIQMEEPWKDYTRVLETFLLIIISHDNKKNCILHV